MESKTTRLAPLLALAILGVVTLGFFQNCSKVDFATMNTEGSLGDPADPGAPVVEVCEGISCDLTPITKKPAVTTILLALGDEANSQLVVNGASAQLIAETIIRYTSPVSDPKILLVADHTASSEDPEDTLYSQNVLLARYKTAFLQAPKDGLKDADLAGYDVVWFNNPGHPLSSKASRDALMKFKGGVVLQGDDLARGDGFDMSELTGLKYIDNGTSVTCAGNSMATDNNSGTQFKVTLDPSKVPGSDASTIDFSYGNDIDNTEVMRSDLEVLASAKGSAAECTEMRPTIVRYMK